MRRTLFLMLCVAMPFVMQAQEEVAVAAEQTADVTPAQPTFLFGYFSYDKVLKSMPDYAQVQADMETLRKQYDSEAKRAEDEFNRKYEDFLEGQHDFAPSILKKRQNELQDILDRNVAFRQEAQRLLNQAEQEALAPLKAKIATALQQLAAIRNYAFVLNTDGDALPYVDTTRGEDINDTLQTILQGGA